ncbi:MAG: ribonuclease J, partial [Pseudonocardiales bacterium]|nr:ribonuclease J [Pseudonocardiales bacterium]
MTRAPNSGRSGNQRPDRDDRSQRPALADPPPPLSAGALRIVALGGIGEIGRNMTVFEHADRLLIVDCGVLFPAEDSPGVDLILP